MGLDAGKLNKLKKEKIDKDRQNKKKAKLNQKEREKNYKAYETRVTNKVVNAWEDFLDSNSDWQDEVQKQIEKYIAEPSWYNSINLAILVTHTATKVIDEIVEEYHDEYDISHFEYKIVEVAIRIEHCKSFKVKVPIDEDFDFKVDTYLNVLEECAKVFVKTLRHNKINAKIITDAIRKEGQYTYNDGVTTYYDPIHIHIGIK